MRVLHIPWLLISSQWVVPENIRTPTTSDILEFRMHGGLLWPGILNTLGSF